MTNLVEAIAKSLVDEPKRVSVSQEETSRGNIITLKVAPNDMGKVIGKQGRIAKAIRTIVRSAAGKVEQKVAVEID